MSWTIKGEAGRTLDDTVRVFDTLNISAASLKFQSLAPDTLNWTAGTTDATGAGTIIPDLGQIIEVFHNGVRKFKGHVTKPVVGMNSVSVSAEGPWWWMTRTGITSDQLDATGATSERPSYVFATGDHKSHIETLINRSITLGVPMALGAVATMFDVPKMTLADQNCASALATMLSWVPDAVAWFDYTPTVPTLNISRRGGMTAQTFAIGTDAVEINEISPRIDLEVTRTELKYVTRAATTGLPQWATQSSGTNVAGKRQIIAVSGPEITDFLPRDDFESFAIQTFSTATPDAAAIAARDSFLSGVLAVSPPYNIGPTNALTTWTGSVSSKSPVVYTFPPLNWKNSAGASVSPTGKYLVRSAGTMPDWLKTQLGAIDVTVVGTWIAYYLSTGTADDFYQAVKDSADRSGSGWENSTPGNNTQIFWAVKSFSFPGVLINTPITTLSTRYKPWEYDYLVPPAGLAAALVAAQNWVPWEGNVKIVADDVTGDNLLSKKFNVTGCLPPCATMATLAKGISHEILNGRTTIELGSPARLDFGTLVSRIKRDPKDNIVYL